ncbi:MAG: protein kinase [Planctomycetes bacterium]|nr:protein kinase [Planctomycetota bacterium]
MLAQTVTCSHCKTVYPLPVSLADAIVAKCPTCGRSATSEAESTRASIAVPIHHAPDSDSALVRPGAPTRGPVTNKFSFLTPPTQPDELGSLGSYRILGVLGAGGMGIVFRAEDPALRRQIALKVMLPHFASDPKSKARFLREARAQAAIEHDHIIDIYQVGEEREIPYIAMPILKGQTLLDALKTNPDVPIGEAIRIAREMAEGLAAAHEQNLIHRDIKPANIWLESRHRRVKILDFGLARAETGAEGTELVSQQGSVVGTPSHMSPEQAQGEPVDARTDLFSLGVVLYQMLTAQQAFAGKNLAATLLAVMSRNPPRPVSLNPLVPPALDLLTMRLLSKNASGRPANAAAVADELRTIEVDLNLTATIPSVSTEAVIADPWMSVAKTDPDSELPKSHLLASVTPASLAELELEAEEEPRRRQRSWFLLPVLLAFAAVAAVAMGIFIAHKSKREPDTKVPDGPLATATKNDSEPAPKLPDDPPIIVPKKADPEPKKIDPEPKKVDPEPKKPDPEPKKVDLEPKKIDPPEEAPPPVPVFDHRTAAEWVINIGGVVRVNELGPDIKLFSELPREPFRLTYVWLRNTKASDAAIACFKDCRTLTYLNLSGTQLTDAALVHFKDCKHLTALNLSNTQVSDAGLIHFRECTNLAAINLSGTEVTDSALANFKDCKGLMYLNLSGTQATDAGLAHFKDCKALTYVGLSKTKVSDAALANFGDCKNLTNLTLSGTKVTAGKLTEFAKMFPLCEIAWDGGVIKPKK